MKFFETLVWLLATLLLLRQLTGSLRGGPAASALVLVIAIALIGLHLFFEGWRKPVLPACAALMLLAALPLLPLPSAGWLARLLLPAGAGLLIGASTVLTWVYPALRYPQPGGPYQVIGMTALPILGTAPAEDMPTPDELRHPPPLVKLWYPAQGISSSPSLLSRQRLSERWRLLGRRGEIFATPALEGALPLTTADIAPLLFYCPGWPGTAVESTALVRELVSHGYYVATLEYPARQPGMSEARWRALKAELERPNAYPDEASYRELVEVSKERVRSRSRDASAAVDRLAAMAADPANPFAGRFDTRRAGFIGFSLGGAVAFQTVNRDPRFVTGINLDGRNWAEAREEGPKRPVLWITEAVITAAPGWHESPIADLRYNAYEDDTDYQAFERNAARDGGTQVAIAGTLHFNFSDHSLISPLRRLNWGGSIAPLRGYEIIYAYTLAWFDRALRGKPSALLDTTATPYPEVVVRYWPAPPVAAQAPEVKTAPP